MGGEEETEEETEEIETEETASAAPTTMLGGGLMSMVARGESAGAGAGVVASRATTAAGTEAELEVPPPPPPPTLYVLGTLLTDKTDPDEGLSALGGSLGGGCGLLVRLSGTHGDGVDWDMTVDVGLTCGCG